MTLAPPRPSQIEAWHANARPLSAPVQTYTKQEGMAAEDALIAKMTKEGPLKPISKRARQAELYKRIKVHLASRPHHSKELAEMINVSQNQMLGMLRAMRNDGTVRQEPQGSVGTKRLPSLWCLNKRNARRAG